MAEVAKLLDIDLSTVSRHESGERGLDRDSIVKYAKLYKTESFELFFDLQGSDEKAPA